MNIHGESLVDEIARRLASRLLGSLFEVGFQEGPSMTFNADHTLETYKSLISISVELLKSLLLLNGGAIVALLAYIGQAENGASVARNATCSLSWFIAGLVLSTLAFIGSYLTQSALYNEGVHPDKYKGSHMPWLWSTFTVGLLSLLAFAVGAYSGVAALSSGAAS